MYETVGNYLRLPSDAEAALIAAARDPSPVRGLTHGYYKYPARFSPLFPRAAIKAFTRRGDVVLDPHVGGGTTIVEAVAAGRAAIGVDISTLAEFVSVVKCTVYSEAELDVLDRWGRRTADRIDIHLPSVGLTDYEGMGYYKHLDHPSRWRLRKAIEQALACDRSGQASARRVRSLRSAQNRPVGTRRSEETGHSRRIQIVAAFICGKKIKV